MAVQILTDLFDLIELIDVHWDASQLFIIEIRKDFNQNSQFSIINSQFNHIGRLRKSAIILTLARAPSTVGASANMRTRGSVPLKRTMIQPSSK